MPSGESTLSFDDSLRHAQGSHEALGGLLEAYRYYLLSVANQEIKADLKAKGGASDIVQETFLEAQRDFVGFEGTTEMEFRAWLRRILLNNLLNFERGYRRTGKRRLASEIPLQTDRSSRDLLAQIRSEVETPSRQAMENEQIRKLIEAATRLPNDYRRVIELRYGRDLAFDDIAQEMDRSPVAVRKLWARAVKRLQAEIQAYE